MTKNKFSDDYIASLNPPAPFRLSVRRGPFTTHNGPWFHWASDDSFRQGVRIVENHCNSRGIVHGGFLSSFADGLAATAIFRSLRRNSVTIKLSTEFLESAKIGDWLQGTAWVERSTRSLAFVEARSWIGETPTMPSAQEGEYIFTASAIFRLFGETS